MKKLLTPVCPTLLISITALLLWSGLTSRNDWGDAPPPSTTTTNCSIGPTGRPPLTDVGPGGYLGYDGGLFPAASNTDNPIHATAGAAIAQSIVPLGPEGAADPVDGKIVYTYIGISPDVPGLVGLAGQSEQRCLRAHGELQLPRPASAEHQP